MNAGRQIALGGQAQLPDENFLLLGESKSLIQRSRPISPMAEGI